MPEEGHLIQRVADVAEDVERIGRCCRPTASRRTGRDCPGRPACAPAATFCACSRDPASSTDWRRRTSRAETRAGCVVRRASATCGVTMACTNGRSAKFVHFGAEFRKRSTAAKSRSSERSFSSMARMSAILRSWKLTRKSRVDAFADLLVDRHFVEARRQRLDRLHRRGDFGVLLLGDRGGDEDAEMADLVVDHVDDALAANLDLMLVGVSVDDPVQRLLRRGDIVAPGGEHDDRRADRLEVELAAALDARLAARQPVADEQICSTIQWISASFMKWKPPHHFSNSRKLLARLLGDWRYRS